jgi:iron complex outermembrane receptor protein
VTKEVQIFGLVNNLFNRKFATYGTFFETGGNAAKALSTPLTDPRMITPIQPLSFYAGVKITF